LNAWSIAFAPTLPLPLLAGLAVAALLLTASAAWRRRRGWAARGLAFALLLLALLDPSLTREDRRPLKDIVAVVVDQSASNQIGEHVMRALQKIDDVAYVRFASVYRSFRDVREFMEELQDLLSERATKRKVKG